MGPNVELETENGDMRGNRNKCEIYNFEKINEKSSWQVIYQNVTRCLSIFAVASSYSDQAKFSTNKGSMNLRNIHNESYVAIYEEGDVKIQGLDGSTNIFIKKVNLK